MGKRIASFFFILAFLYGGVSISGAIQLPWTGQDKCYTWQSPWEEIPSCLGTGQDGEYQMEIAWPDPRFTVNGDCVIDNLTGLMWARNGNLPNGTLTWNQAIDYANDLNDPGFCGYLDWRLPNVNELESLVNANENDSATWLNARASQTCSRSTTGRLLPMLEIRPTRRSSIWRPATARVPPLRTATLTSTCGPFAQVRPHLHCFGRQARP
jgi:hypothetical protein